MSQLILDDQLDVREVLRSLQKWVKVQRLCDLRPNERILDDRVPEILLSVGHPTFVTIDKDFWDRRLCHPKYAILYFALRDDEQELLPGLLRSLLRRKEFRTRVSRMGKVARVSSTRIDYWQFQLTRLQRVSWKGVR